MRLMKLLRVGLGGVRMAWMGDFEGALKGGGREDIQVNLKNHDALAGVFLAGFQRWNRNHVSIQ